MTENETNISITGKEHESILIDSEKSIVLEGCVHAGTGCGQLTNCGGVHDDLCEQYESLTTFVNRRIADTFDEVTRPSDDKREMNLFGGKVQYSSTRKFSIAEKMDTWQKVIALAILLVFGTISSANMMGNITKMVLGIGG